MDKPPNLFQLGHFNAPEEAFAQLDAMHDMLHWLIACGAPEAAHETQTLIDALEPLRLKVDLLRDVWASAERASIEWGDIADVKRINDETFKCP